MQQSHSNNLVRTFSRVARRASVSFNRKRNSKNSLDSSAAAAGAVGGGGNGGGSLPANSVLRGERGAEDEVFYSDIRRGQCWEYFKHELLNINC